MAFTNKGTKWELKNSIFLLFSFIPFINSICFFHMVGEVPNRKWKRLGWIFLFCNILMVSLYLIMITTSLIVRYWSTAYGIFFAFFFMNLIIFFYLISQRADYLRALAKITNKNDIMNRLENTNNMVRNNRVESVSKNQENKISEKIDINRASEEKISNMPGLTIVDAKKAIKYREEHNGFETIDEFFSVIGAKPHIIAKLEDNLIVSKSSKHQNTDLNNKRRIDL